MRHIRPRLTTESARLRSRRRPPCGGLRGLGRRVCRALASPTPWSASIAGAGFEPVPFGL